MSEVFQSGLLGMGTGAIYALLALGIVVIFRGSGVLNLAQGAYAMVGAFAFNDLRAEAGWPLLPAVIVTVLGVAALGAATEAGVIRRLRSASPLSRLIATLGVLIIIQTLATIRWGSTLSIAEAVFPNNKTSILGTVITADRLWIVGTAVVLTTILALVSNRTRAGWVTTAVAENETSAAALGISPDTVSLITWAIGAGLAGLAGILVAPIVQLNVLSITLLVVPALAAALLGGFRSFPAMLIGGLVVGVLQAEAGNYVNVVGAAEAIPFLVIVAVLVFRGSALPLRGHVFDVLPRVGSGQFGKRWLILPVVGVLVSLLVTSDDWLAALTGTFGVAIVLLSLVVLVGYAGQLSLAQYALAGIGALVAARLIAAQGFPFPIAVVAAVIATAAVGALFALPALRTRGVNLAVVTLGLGVATQAVIFNNGDIVGGESGTTVGNITFFGLGIDPFDHPNRYAVFTVLLLTLSALVVINVRRGAIGRRLLAIRSNERAAAAAGVHILRSKMEAFVIAGALAGLGGVALGFRSTTVTFTTYQPLASINAVAESVIGSVGFVLGPLVGALTDPGSVLLLVGLHWPNLDKWLPLVGGIGVLATLIANPDGVVSSLSSRRPRRKKASPEEKTSVVELGKPERTRVTPRELVVDDLAVHYGGVVAVSGVSFSVAPGEVVGLIGPNGAGKTSLMDAVTGFTPAAAGTIKLDGVPISGWAPHRRANNGLSRSFQAMELFGDMTVSENLLVAGETATAMSSVTELVKPKGPRLTDAAVAAVHDFGLTEVLERRADDLPYGVRRLVAIARAVAGEPSVVLLDEPVAGLDEHESAEFAQLVRSLADDWGMGVLVIEHDMSFVMEISDRVVVLDFGRKIAEGAPAEIRDDPAALAAYLGDPEAEDEVEILA